LQRLTKEVPKLLGYLGGLSFETAIGQPNHPEALDLHRGVTFPVALKGCTVPVELPAVGLDH